MRSASRAVNLIGMLRRAAVAILAITGTCLLAGAPARATISRSIDWDVDLTGKERTQWTFAGTIPDSCSDDYGSPGYEANGNGSHTLSVATTQKRRLAATTYRMGGKLRFSSFSTDGWQIPATVSKAGTASMRYGKPCDSDPGDPEPLPELSDAGGCSAKKGTSSPSLTWTPGRLVVDLGSGPPEPLAWITRCPDLSDPKLFAIVDSTCGPKDPGAIYLSALKFMLPKPKRFTVEKKQRFVCPIPSTKLNWRNGSASLTLELSVSYSVTFTPRKQR